MKIPKWIILSFLTAGFLGFLDAVYLTVGHYKGLFLNCFVGSCGTVLSSQYAAVGGIPVALLGTVYYFIIFISAAAYIDSRKEFFIKFAARFTIVGFLASLWFLFLQFFVIKGICLYCIISAGVSISLFILGMLILKRKSYYFI